MSAAEIVTGKKAEQVAERILAMTRRDHSDWWLSHSHKVHVEPSKWKVFGRLPDVLDADTWTGEDRAHWIAGLKLYSMIARDYHLSDNSEVSKHLAKLIRAELRVPAS